MIGHSRKSMFAEADVAGDDRLTPTIAATSIAADRGADVVRVHDVAENVAAIRTVTRGIDGE
jgi:dihydropteroate synthase